MKVLVVLGLAGGLLAGALARAEDRAAPTDADVLTKVERYRDELRAVLETPDPSCLLWSPPTAAGAPSACSFQAICRQLQANDRTSYLYRNAAGQGVPNFAVWQAEESLHECYVALDAKRHPADPSKWEGLARTQLNERLQTRKAFLDSVRANKEQDVYQSLLEASTELALEKAEASDRAALPRAFGRWKPFTEPEARAEVDRLEKKSGRRLSDASRRLYVDLLVKESHPITDGRDPKLRFPEWSPLNLDPFLNTRLLYDEKAAGGSEKLHAFQARYEKETLRAFHVFERSRDGIIAVLNARRTPANTAAIDNFIHRVQTIRFSPAEIGSFDPSCAAPNAFYDDSTHSFVVCPQFAELPDFALEAIVAHELSHSIDPCTASGALYSSDVPAAPIPPLGPQPAVDGGPPSDTGPFKPNVPDSGVKNRQLAVDEYDLGPDGFPTGTTGLKLEEPGIGLDGNPLRTVVQCLSRPDSIGARMPSETELRRTTSNAISQLRGSGATEATSPMLRQLVKTQANIHKLLASKGACSFIPGANGRSQAQEAFADWMSGEALGRGLSADDDQTRRQNAAEALLSLPAMGCGGLGSATLTRIDQEIQGLHCRDSSSVTDSLDALSGAGESAQDEHPKEKSRIERLYLANPRVRQALGCAPAKMVHCE